MEKHIERQPAQEFSTGALKGKGFLGAIRVRRLRPHENGYNQDPRHTVYKIVDGLANHALLQQFKQVPSENLYKVVKLYGLEGQAAHYLTRAILFAKKDEGDKFAQELLEAMEKNQYLNFESNDKVIEVDRVRTQYQEQFDDLKIRRDTIVTAHEFSGAYSH